MSNHRKRHGSSNPFRLSLNRQRVEPQFFTQNGHLVMHVQMSEDQPIPLLSFSFTFETPDEFKEFFVSMLEAAAKAWPDDEIAEEWNAP